MINLISKSISISLTIIEQLKIILYQEERITIDLIASSIEKNVTIPNQEEHFSILILLEDKRYLKHKGFDLRGVIRALYMNTLHDKKQGASTIEQQLVRTITNEKEITKRRKIREILRASYISKKFTKQDIISSYIKLAYYGHELRYNSLISKNKSTFTTAILSSFLKHPVPMKITQGWEKKVIARSMYGIRHCYPNANISSQDLSLLLQDLVQIRKNRIATTTTTKKQRVVA